MPDDTSDVVRHQIEHAAVDSAYNMHIARQMHDAPALIFHLQRQRVLAQDIGAGLVGGADSEAMLEDVGGIGYGRQCCCSCQETSGARSLQNLQIANHIANDTNEYAANVYEHAKIRF